MIQSTPSLHVAIIMDGNGRWATASGLPRIAGHQAGADAVRRVIEAAPDFDLGTLTLYAFSSDNWRRPDAEVTGLMQLFRRYLLSQTAKCVENGIRLEVIGRRDRLPAALLAAVQRTEAATRYGRRLRLRIAVDYSARDAIVTAARHLKAEDEPSRDAFSSLLARAVHAESAPDVDVLIRTGGEQRLSDFLLWECAYAELFFTRRMWPDFDRDDLAAALRDFSARERRFGSLPAAG